MTRGTIHQGTSKSQHHQIDVPAPLDLPFLHQPRVHRHPVGCPSVLSQWVTQPQVGQWCTASVRSPWT